MRTRKIPYGLIVDYKLEETIIPLAPRDSLPSGGGTIFEGLRAFGILS